MWLHLTVVVCLCVGLSFQLQECELSSGQLRDSDLGGVLTAQDTCKEGFISWHYPRGNLTVQFPRSVAGSDVRKPMRVCVKTDLGDGVTGIQQIRTNRRGRVRAHNMPLPEDGESYTCSRPSRRNDGISLLLLSDGPSYYLQVIGYKVEVIERRRGGNRGRNKNSRRRPYRRPEVSPDIRGVLRDDVRFAGRPKYPNN